MIVWIIAIIMGISLDIACMDFIGICFTVGGYFALLAKLANYAFPAQTMLFLFISIGVYLVTSPCRKKLKNIKRKRRKMYEM